MLCPWRSPRYTESLESQPPASVAAVHRDSLGCETVRISPRKQRRAWDKLRPSSEAPSPGFIEEKQPGT